MNTEITECIILQENYAHSLDRRIKIALDQGYQPLGPAVASSNGIIITMVKYKEGQI